MTNRIDRLEKRGYVERSRDDADGRVVWVSLTEAGRDVIDRALPAHAENERRLVSALTEPEREALIALTRKLHASLSPGQGQPHSTTGIADGRPARPRA